MAGLNIKITADTAGAAAALRNLADGSEEMAEKIQKANGKLASLNVQGFVERQSLTAAALTATRGELGAVETSITAYQRKIESLIKTSLAPESEQVKTLQFELETLKERRCQLEAQAASAAEAERRLAEAWKEASEAAAREADIVIKSLDAKTGLEKANIRLASGQDELKNKIRELVESGVKPESAEVQKLQGEYKKLSAEIEANVKAEELRHINRRAIPSSSCAGHSVFPLKHSMTGKRSLTAGISI